MIKPALYIAILLLSFVTTIHAQQNLVVNGDFEEYSSCPVGFSNPFQNPQEIEKCTGWNAPTFGTSDFYNVCAFGTNVAVPNNPFGTQTPFSGNGYLGGYFSCYTGGTGSDGYSGIMWWEYMQGRLIAPLEQGKIYKFSMEVSLAELSDLMITEMGAYFSNYPVSTPNTASLDLSPQCIFYNPNFYRDTINWLHLETLFIASGGEQYITIGNFRNNVETDTLRRYNLEPSSPNFFATYFYIDQVVVTESSSLLDISNGFSPNGDGLNDKWFLPFSGGSEKVSILNRWGNLIYEEELNGFSWDGKTQTGTECTEGTYFYRISNTNIAGFIELMR